MTTNIEFPRSDVAEPADDFEAISPSNSAVLDPPAKALFVGTGGIVVLRSRLGTTVSFTVQDGQILPVRFDKLLADDGGSPLVSTTATGLVALY